VTDNGRTLDPDQLREVKGGLSFGQAGVLGAVTGATLGWYCSDRRRKRSTVGSYVCAPLEHFGQY